MLSCRVSHKYRHTVRRHPIDRRFLGEHGVALNLPHKPYDACEVIRVGRVGVMVVRRGEADDSRGKLSQFRQMRLQGIVGM
jgi:hypothetical protein